jgi:uncharacterized protein (DUF1800 family)
VKERIAMTSKLAPVDKLDPADAWQPWQPTPADPWGRKWVAHLYRRAGFGANRDELLEAERLGFEGAINLILNGKTQNDLLQESLDDDGQVAIRREKNGEEIRGWWIYRMIHGPHPLREKMTLFWHNHFATSIVKVQSEGVMVRQNRLLRTHALGKFGPFLQAMSKDEAMLKWLDSNSNVKGKPNENYARELMELFSLGVGNYTEKDIREAARAFTGWHTNTSGFWFNSSLHDDGTKTVFGQTGKWDGSDVVRIVLEQPAVARFIVRKLYQFFIAETAVPPDAFIEPLCDGFRKSDYDIAALVKTMLTSRHFYSEHAFRQRIKSPVEFVLGAVRAVYRLYDETSDNYSPLQHRLLISRLSDMGQHLFAPPNVKGWPGARAWLNTSTVLERDNFAGGLALGTLWTKTSKGIGEEPPPIALDPARLLREEKVNSPDDVLRAILDLYVPGGIRPEAKTKLLAFLSEGKPTGSALDLRVRELVHAVMAMPEHQLA